MRRILGSIGKPSSIGKRSSKSHFPVRALEIQVVRADRLKVRMEQLENQAAAAIPQKPRLPEALYIFPQPARLQRLIPSIQRLFCESGGPNNQVGSFHCNSKTAPKLICRQGRGSPSPARHRRSCRVKPASCSRGCQPNPKIPVQRQLPASLRPIQCHHARAHPGRQSRQIVHKEHR